MDESFPRSSEPQQGADRAPTLERLLARFRPMVYRRALALLRDPDDARDATQDVFVKAIRRGDALQEDASSWFYRVTTNTCLNRLRGRRRRRATHERNLLGTSAHTNAAADAHCLVRALLADAEVRCAEAAIYVYIQELSHEEAALQLGVSRRTVGNLLTRFETWAKARLESDDAPASSTGPGRSSRIEQATIALGAGTTKHAVEYSAGSPGVPEV